jgi:hypothetical protein
VEESFKDWIDSEFPGFTFPFPPTKEPFKTIELENFGWVRVDSHLYPLLSQYKWFATAYDRTQKRFVASRRELQPNGRYKSIYMHSEIIRRYVAFAPCRFPWPLPSDVHVEFKNNCSLDCMTANIRLVTAREHIDLLAIRKSNSKGEQR